jgi:DNA-binding winged helix-turn-helix (wHTH) protein
VPSRIAHRRHRGGHAGIAGIAREVFMPLAFGDCVLDLERHELRRRGAPVPLASETYRLLEILIEQRPRVVARHELEELLWPSSYVAGSSLERVVSVLRSALADDPDTPQLIVSVHAVGYAFGGAVAQVGAPAVQIAPLTLLWSDRAVGLGTGEHLLGRGPDCDVLIQAPGVSRNHARIVVAGSSTTIADLGSRNGTYVNRRRISGPSLLRDGDEIAIGTVIITVRAPGGGGTTQTLYLR